MISFLGKRDDLRGILRLMFITLDCRSGSRRRPHFGRSESSNSYCRSFVVDVPKTSTENSQILLSEDKDQKSLSLSDLQKYSNYLKQITKKVYMTLLLHDNRKVDNYTTQYDRVKIATSSERKNPI